MIELWSAVAAAFGVVFVAELGDKTQLLALGFGARHRLSVVALGLTLGFGAASAIAAVAGGVLGATLPQRPIAIVGGFLFIGFAIVTLRGGDGHGDRRTAVRAHNVVASIALSILVAEMGDKTQLATAALAAQGQPFGTWIGATAGEVAASMVGAVAGRRLGNRIDSRTLDVASAVLFATFGVILLITAG